MDGQVVEQLTLAFRKIDAAAVVEADLLTFQVGQAPLEGEPPHGRGRCGTRLRTASTLARSSFRLNGFTT